MTPDLFQRMQMDFYDRLVEEALLKGDKRADLKHHWSDSSVRVKAKGYPIDMWTKRIRDAAGKKEVREEVRKKLQKWILEAVH